MTGDGRKESELVRFVADMVGAGSGTFLVAGPHEAAVAIAGVAGSSMLESAAGRLSERTWRRRRLALDSAATLSTLTVEALLARVLADDELLALFGDVMRAAADVATEREAATLGRALRDGVIAEDRAAVDRSRRVVRTLRDLDALDLRLLVQLSKPVPGLENTTFPDRAFRYSPNTLRQQLPELSDVIDAGLADLSRNGLIEQSGQVPTLDYQAPAPWVLTGYGRWLLEYLLTDTAPEAAET
jgi:hypothetical protein